MRPSRHMSIAGLEVSIPPMPDMALRSRPGSARSARFAMRSTNDTGIAPPKPASSSARSCTAILGANPFARATISSSLGSAGMDAAHSSISARLASRSRPPRPKVRATPTAARTLVSGLRSPGPCRYGGASPPPNICWSTSETRTPGVRAAKDRANDRLK